MEKINKKEILFGAGCFWGVEENFRVKEGVLETEVGYTGGQTDNPTYKDICYNETGHAEVVRVVYNEEIISTEDVIRFFFKIHNPREFNRQGPDVGSQYRSAIFYNEENQRDISEKVKAELNSTDNVSRVATEISKAQKFYPAEDYHQKYLMKKGLKVCH